MTADTTAGAAPASSLPPELQAAFATAVSRLLELHDYHARCGRRAIANDFGNAVTAVAALRKAMLSYLASGAPAGAWPQIVATVQAYLPPDGMSKDEFVSRVIGVVDSAPTEAPQLPPAPRLQLVQREPGA